MIHPLQDSRIELGHMTIHLSLIIFFFVEWPPLPSSPPSATFIRLSRGCGKMEIEMKLTFGFLKLLMGKIGFLN